MRPIRPSRLRALLLTVALAACSAPAFAQDAVVSFNPRTGDVWVDTWLGDINRYGRTYRDPFVDELVRYHRAPRDLVVELLTERGWSPGDVYFACALAAQVGRPCRAIVDEYERDRGEGWGALAQRMGIRPGSPQFHALKRGIVPSYDRWGRPIQIDTDLARDFPGRRVGAPPRADRDDDRGDRGPAGDRPGRGDDERAERGQAKADPREARGNPPGRATGGSPGKPGKGGPDRKGDAAGKGAAGKGKDKGG